jgi:diguanylate cyclase (GGDEF)-like protein
VTAEPLKVLLVEDDEDDFLMARSLLSEMESRKVDLEWVANYQDALRAIERGGHDVCLVDYYLGERNGLELLREAADAKCTVPMIMLTGQSACEIDAEAMEAGAADYLVKNQVDGRRLEHSIRYALQRSIQMEALRRHASHDELTGLYNRRAMICLLKEEVERYQRYGRPFALVMLDVDYFKTINDSYGHLVGDEVLRWLVGIIRTTVRTVDKPARFGGEELAIILPEMTCAQALKLAERLRRRVAAHAFSFCERGRSLQIPVTISLGVAALPGDATDVENLIAAADEGLYAAKRGGRNRSVYFHTSACAQSDE